MRRSTIGTLVTLAAVSWIVLAATGDGAAQIPEKYTNLQVLPKDITRGELVDVMREVAGSLGVRCNHCHVGPEDLTGMDFATDEKATKRTARTMMKMVEEINGRYLRSIKTGRAETVRVRCFSCHHGLPVPKGIDEILTQTIETKGVTAALDEYRKLRDEHYGSSAYDFSQGPLNMIVERLGRQQKLDQALAIARANIELNPGKPYPHLLLGRIHLARGEKELAIAAMRKGVELDPTNAFARKQLEELTAPREEPEEEK